MTCCEERDSSAVIHTYIHAYIHTYIHTYIHAFEYLPEPNPRMLNKVFIGTKERSDVWT